MRTRQYLVLGGAAMVAFAIVAACVGENPDTFPAKDDATAPDVSSTDTGTPLQDTGAPIDTGTDTSPPSTRSISCGITKCVGTQICCNAADASGAYCVEPGNCPNTIGSVIACDDPTDCLPGYRCCGTTLTEDGGASDYYYVRAECTVTPIDAGCGALELCRSGAGALDCFRQTACINIQPEYKPPTLTICQ